MKLLDALAAMLAFAGRHGTLLAAASIFIGLAVPGLAATCKPYLSEAIVVMLTLAFLRVDPEALLRHFTRPSLIAAATVWTMLVAPATLGIMFLAFGLDQRMPGLYFMLVLQMSAPGLMSSPALAALLGSTRYARQPDCGDCDHTFDRKFLYTSISWYGSHLTALRPQVVFNYRRLRLQEPSSDFWQDVFLSSRSVSASMA